MQNPRDHAAGTKNREALPLLCRLASQGWVGISGRPGTWDPSAPLAYDAAAAPPSFVARGDHDSLIPVAAPRLFAGQLRATSANPVLYAELPGAQHGFDRFHSRCFDTVVDGIEAFAAWVRSSRPAAAPSPARYDAARLRGRPQRARGKGETGGC